MENTPAAKAKVLIIEDDKFFIDLLAKRLSQAGFAVLFANDGKSGIAIIKTEKPAVVLLDVLLPETDGFEVLSQIKADESTKAIPVILLSNLGSKENLEKSQKFGAYNFMIKATVSLDQIIKEATKAISSIK
ncbi:MAG: response regulator [Candidatus Paceibacterota bacterium]|jgi:CheY-like chemotaxis protein